MLLNSILAPSFLCLTNLQKYYLLIQTHTERKVYIYNFSSDKNEERRIKEIPPKKQLFHNILNFKCKRKEGKNELYKIKQSKNEFANKAKKLLAYKL